MNTRALLREQGLSETVIEEIIRDHATVRMMPVEVYSRVVGYFRPVNQWNPGKRQEFEERVPFGLGKIKGGTA